MGLLYGRAGRLTTEIGVFRPGQKEQKLHRIVSGEEDVAPPAPAPTKLVKKPAGKSATGMRRLSSIDILAEGEPCL